MGGAEKGIRGVSRGNTWVPKRQEQALDQQTDVEGDRREEGNEDQAGQHQVREDTEEAQQEEQAEGQGRR